MARGSRSCSRSCARLSHAISNQPPMPIGRMLLVHGVVLTAEAPVWCRTPVHGSQRM